MNEAYKGTLRNTGEAYRQFRTAGALYGVQEKLRELMAHRLIAAAIVAMGAAGLFGIVLVFFR